MFRGNEHESWNEELDDLTPLEFYEWLLYFFQEADFGPADDDVKYAMWENYKKQKLGAE